MYYIKMKPALIIKEEDVGNEIYKNIKLSYEARVDDLLNRLNIDEKIAQLVSISQIQIDRLDEENFEIKNLEKKVKHGIGAIQLPAKNFPPELGAKIINKIQEIIMSLGNYNIPALIHEECLSGQVAKGATMFPKPIGLACTFDEELVKSIYDAIGKETKARGGNQAFTPVLDIARDPRWGRYEETFGEDTYLVGRMGLAAVTGLQGGTNGVNSEHIVSSVKHFAGYAQSDGGRNFAPSVISNRKFIDEILPPFKIAIKDGKAGGIMPSHSELDGIPCHCNKELLTDLLRKVWGFDGIVVSDYNDVERLNILHYVAKDRKEAAVKALIAGVDMDIPTGNAYKYLSEAVNENKEIEEYINSSVRRVLLMKFKLGLFDNPFVDPKKACALVRCEKHNLLARKAAEESIVMLKNNILPLNISKTKKIAIIGPCAHPVHFSYYSTAPHEGVSILDGIKDHVGNTTDILYSEGCRLTKQEFTMETELDTILLNEPELYTYEEEKENIEQAVDAARNSDLAVVCLGGSASTSREAIFFNNISGDNDSLELVGYQEKLLEEISKVNQNVIVIIVSGKPYSNESIYKNSKAVLQCFYAGQATGTAIAGILFGLVNPSGKLPVSIARNVGQLPVYYSQKQTGSFKNYLFAERGPLFPFGFGLSYTTFEYKNLMLDKQIIDTNDKLSISVTVINTGRTYGEEIVQLYISDLISSVTRPIKELKRFKRVNLNPGQEAIVEFELLEEDLRFTRLDMTYGSEDGEFKVMVGPNSQEGLTDTFQLEGTNG